MEVGWPGRRAGPFAEMEFRLVLYVKEQSRQAGQPSRNGLRIVVLRIACKQAGIVQLKWRGIIVEEVKQCLS